MSGPASPIVNALNDPFWRGAAEGRLVLPFCVQTGRAFWPPSPVSPFATGGAVEWREAASIGTMRAMVIYRRSFQEAFKSLMPYGIGLVELDAGPRLQVHVPTPDAAAAPHSGDRVGISFVRLIDHGERVPVAHRLS